MKLNYLNTTHSHAQLLMPLRYDCQVKNASLGLTVVPWALYVATTGLFTTDAMKIYC